MYGAVAIRLAADLQRPQVAAIVLDPSRQGLVPGLNIPPPTCVFSLSSKRRSYDSMKAMNENRAPPVERLLFPRADGLEEHDQARAAQLAEFNRELSRRLDALDRGEAVKPAEARRRLQQKSEQRKRRA